MALHISKLRKAFIDLISSVKAAAQDHVKIDGFRVNTAWERLHKIKNDPMYKKSKNYPHRQLVNQDLLRVKVNKADAALRKAMGISGYETGKARTAHVKFHEWHGVAKAAVTLVNEARSFIKRSNDKIALVLETERSKKERKQMQKEERELKAFLRLQTKDDQQLQKQRDFVKECRRAWARGQNLKQRDRIERVESNQLEEEMAKREYVDMVKRSAKARYDWSHRMDLSVWTAVKEGCTTMILENLIKEENNRGREHGAKPFRLHDPHPHTGETLIQIACWYGHVHLVEYFMEKGANVRQIDCLSNRFTLLHDAARVGAPDIIKLLIQTGGIPADAKDASGDTALHWSVRNNDVQSTCAILESDPVDSVGMTPVWKSLAARNNRGRTPLDLAELKNATVLQKVLLRYEVKLQQRRAEEGPMTKGNAKNIRLLRKEGRKQGRQAVVQILKNQSTIHDEDVSLIGRVSAQSGQVAQSRKNHFRNKKMIATGVGSFPQQVRKNVAKQAGQAWMKKAASSKYAAQEED